MKHRREVSELSQRAALGLRDVLDRMLPASGGVTPALSTSEQEWVYERTPNGPEPVLSLVVVTATFVRLVGCTTGGSKHKSNSIVQ